MRSLKALKQNNKGVGTVTVILALSFLTTLGLLVLALSYTSSEMRSSERTGREVAYNANGVVEQIRSGVQLAVSDAIKDCYLNTMTNYSAYRDTIEEEFDRNFKESLKKWAPYKIANSKKYYYAPGAEEPEVELYDPNGISMIKLFALDGTNISYNVEALEKMVRTGFACRDWSVTYQGTVPQNAGFGRVVWDDEKSQAILKDVEVSYSKLFRTVNIRTDIIINFPDLGYVYQEESKGSNFTEFAIIAKEKIIHQNGDVFLLGRAYANELNIAATTFDHQFKVGNGSISSTLIVKENVNVRGRKTLSAAAEQAINSAVPESNEALRQATYLKEKSAFVVEDGSTLWADGIKVFTNSIVGLCSRENIANDLDLAGYKSQAVLMGDYYYGFGGGNDLVLDEESGTMKKNPDASNPAKNSAILFNGAITDSTSTNDVTLDISQLDALTLAGFSFVDVYTANTETGVGGSAKMGQSMAVKKDMRAYLVPVSMLNYDNAPLRVNSNPEVFNTQEDFLAFKSQLDQMYFNEPVNDVTNPLWFDNVNGEQVPVLPAQYGIRIKSISKPYAGQYLGYFFMEFVDTVNPAHTGRENANRYFRDYFAHHPEEIESYVNQHIELTAPKSSFKERAVGNLFRKDSETDKIGLSPLTSLINFESISQTVTEKITFFKNLCETLNTKSSKADAEETDRQNAASPFEYYVNTAAVTQAFATLQSKGKNADRILFLNGEDLVAIITRDSFTYNDEGTVVDPYDSSKRYPMNKLCLIISTADVTIQSDFTGLVMTSGNVTVAPATKADGTVSVVTLTSDSDAVTTAATALSDVSRDELGLEELEGFTGGMPYEFVYGEFTPPGGHEETEEDTYWDLSTLVYFDHYKKL